MRKLYFSPQKNKTKQNKNDIFFSMKHRLLIAKERNMIFIDY